MGDGSDNSVADSGQVHVFYGGALASTIDLSSSSSSLTFFGEWPNDQLGRSTLVYDANGDGNEDLALGSTMAAGNYGSFTESGAIWIIFNANLGSVSRIDSFAIDQYIYGADAGDHASASLFVADIDGDGTEDLLVGAPDADGVSNTAASTGEVALILATTLDGINDLGIPNDTDAIFYGGAPSDKAGSSVSAVEATGDSFQDILIGVPGQGSPPGASARVAAGGAYLVKGRSDWSAVDGTSLDETSDLAIFGASADLELGDTVRFADYDGDTVIDYLLGAPKADGPSGGRADAGGVIVIDGNSVGAGQRVYDLALFPPAQQIHGASANDGLGGSGWLPLAELDGSAGLELTIPAQGGDGPADDRSDAGEAWMIAQDDMDWDGFPNDTDCAPTDGNTGALANTGSGSTFAVDKKTFSWSAVANADFYSIYRGTIEVSWAYNESCLDGNLTSPEYVDATTPATGQAFWYDSSARTSGGCAGPMGNDSTGNVRDSTPPACP